jgi:hypothetical protein
MRAKKHLLRISGFNADLATAARFYSRLHASPRLCVLPYAIVKSAQKRHKPGLVMVFAQDLERLIGWRASIEDKIVDTLLLVYHSIRCHAQDASRFVRSGRSGVVAGELFSGE